ncbi:hypothetical protein KVH22_30095 [Streptomyces olivaceus]|uniref:hypothetical protein n=1 Tax=Streptomyces TaxID=1883 RepID=UPI001CCB03D2|nr:MULTISPECIES: hypothetical protein [Streptomyces]MBZ6175608.1 hypothetical protein [Streptomyces olivaceus]MBZ6181850.1 hypothetical protein [Streptomyces olivaceus]MBZ6259772.1 hypothetical protein [Streptomyces olivaceus]MCM8550078.1 hypothetical protein [Streptomyces sp. STCH 565 A]
MKITRYGKAIAGAVSAGAGSLATALADERLTLGEGITAVLVVLGALGVTWYVPNKEPKDGSLNDALRRADGSRGPS